MKLKVYRKGDIKRFIPGTKRVVPRSVSSCCLHISSQLSSWLLNEMFSTRSDWPWVVYFIPVPSTGMNFERLTLSTFPSPWVQRKTDYKKNLFFTRKEPSLCTVFLLEARTFCSLKFSKLILTAKPTGKEVYNNRKCLVKLPKFMHDERDLSLAMNHPRTTFAVLSVPPWVSRDLQQNVRPAPLAQVRFDIERSLRI